MILKFYSSADKSLLTKKQIVIKSVSFYIVSQTAVILSIWIFYLVLKFSDIDPYLFYPHSVRNCVPDQWYLAVFIGPVIEEIAFRLGISFDKKDLAVSLPVLCFILLSAAWGGYSSRIAIKCMIGVCVFVFLIALPRDFSGRYASKFGKQTVVGLVFLFGYLHLINFDISVRYLPVYVFLCSPQIIMGMTFSYLRLNAGFMYAVAAHITVNGISVFFQVI
ncbi:MULTISPECIES: hypothetical protein [unclassified Bacteroides]|uniref:hypothetical protein n=1 Tax=unclassified Bacteroides TaxID=2646097 RepID=UPI00406377A2